MSRALAAAVSLLASVGLAHETLPATLSLTEREPGHFDVQLRLPAREGAPPPLRLGFPPGCHPEGEARQVFERGASVQRSRLACPALRSARIEVEGLVGSPVDLLVRLRFGDGGSKTLVVPAGQTGFDVQGPTARWEYLRLGVEHILTGFDHLLFVLGLLLLVRRVKPLVQTVTAFTLAHSVTLGLAVLGVVRVPVAPVEATIALSIVFLARELVRQQQGITGLSSRQPWLVAFSFGLLHGFGFAGALSGAGIPQPEIPFALLLFNVGVELGQLAFVAACLLLARAGRSLLAARSGWARVPPYAIGALSAFWFLQRLAVMW